MRLEEIEKEAELYNGYGDCYIHMERANHSHGTCVVAGDQAAIEESVYHMICEMSRQFEKPFMEILKSYKKTYRKYGIANHSVIMGK